MKGLEVIQQFFGRAPREREVVNDLPSETARRLVSYLEQNQELWVTLSRLGNLEYVVLSQEVGSKELSVARILDQRGENLGISLEGRVGHDLTARWARIRFEWAVPMGGGGEPILVLSGVETKLAEGGLTWLPEQRNRDFLLRGAYDFFDPRNLRTITTSI